MSILCRVGLHKWKIVQRYVPGGFLASCWPGVVGRVYHEYKGTRCKRCRAWRKEGRWYWWQWAGLAMFAGPICAFLIWAAGLAMFFKLLLLTVVVLAVIAGFFMMICGDI